MEVTQISRWLLSRTLQFLDAPDMVRASWTCKAFKTAGTTRGLLQRADLRKFRRSAVRVVRRGPGLAAAAAAAAAAAEPSPVNPVGAVPSEPPALGDAPPQVPRGPDGDWVLPPEQVEAMLARYAEAGNVQACYVLGMLYVYCYDRYAEGRDLLRRAATSTADDGVFLGPSGDSSEGYARSLRTENAAARADARFEDWRLNQGRQSLGFTDLTEKPGLIDRLQSSARQEHIPSVCYINAEEGKSCSQLHWEQTDSAKAANEYLVAWNNIRSRRPRSPRPQPFAFAGMEVCGNPACGRRGTLKKPLNMSEERVAKAFMDRERYMKRVDGTPCDVGDLDSEKAAELEEAVDAALEEQQALNMMPPPLKKCERCQTKKYCSKYCQVVDWNKHIERCFTPQQVAQIKHAMLTQQVLAEAHQVQAAAAAAEANARADLEAAEAALVGTGFVDGK